MRAKMKIPALLIILYLYPSSIFLTYSLRNLCEIFKLLSLLMRLYSIYLDEHLDAPLSHVPYLYLDVTSDDALCFITVKINIVQIKDAAKLLESKFI